MKKYKMSYRSLFFLFATCVLLSSLASEQSIARQSTTDSSWIMLDESDGEPMQRHEGGYVAIGDKFYLFGGRDERPVNIYDPAADSWETGAIPPLPLHHLQGVVYNDDLFVLGAFTGGYPGETPVPHIYIYHPDTDQWEQGPEIPENRRRGAAAAVEYQGKIYVIGGMQNGHTDGHVLWFDSYDPETGQWEELPNIPRHRDHFHAVIIDDVLYLAGGRRTSFATQQVFDLTIPEVDVYNFQTGEWDNLPPSADLPTERAGTTAVAMGKYMIVLGGESGAQNDAHAEVEAFNTVTGEWLSLPELNTGRHATQVILHNGSLYIASGSRVRGAIEINSQEKLVLPADFLE